MAETEPMTSLRPGRLPDLQRAFVFSLAVTAVAVVYANATPYWFDEIVTIDIIRMPGLGALWSILCHGPDPNPPLSYAAFMGARALFGESHVGLRIPSMIGFLAACLALFCFARRRFPSRIAWSAALLLFVSGAFGKAYEARGYALYLGFASLALLAWQIAAESTGTRRGFALAGLVLALAAGISTHWFFILMLAPLCLGEAARSFFTTKRIDLAVWMAFGVGFLPLLLFGPLIKNGRDFSGDFWAKPTLHGVIETYHEFSIKLAVPVLFLLAVALLPRVLRRWSTPRTEVIPSTGLPLHELVASIGLAVLPIFGFLLAKIMHGGFTSRYVIPTYLGAALLLAQAMFWTDRRLRLPTSVFPIFLILYAVGNYAVLTPMMSKGRYTWPVAHLTRPAILDQTDLVLPLVITDPHVFLQHAYYRTRSGVQGPDYSYIPQAVAGEDTMLLCMTRLRPISTADIRDYDEFLKRDRRFYLLTTVGNPLRKRLLGDGWVMKLLRDEGETRLELVSAPPRLADSTSDPVKPTK